MWRRALLAAVALSCTLPTRARAQPTQRLTQIQDLICVLIMSGMQKEDLDVTMLRKMQRYNVNIDDINNERIRQQCSSRNNGFTASELNDQIKEGSLTTEYKPTISSLNPSTLNIDTIINYLQTRDNNIRNLDETRKTTHTEENVTPPPGYIEKKPKTDKNLLRRYIELETQNKSFFKLDENSETTKYNTSINLKTNEGQSNSVDAVFIEKLLKDYIDKKQKIHTTTESYTTVQSIDIQNIYKQIDKIIANRSTVNIKEMRPEINTLDINKPSKQNIISPIHVTPMSQENHYPTGNQLFESFYNFINEMNRLKNNFSQAYGIYNNTLELKEKTKANNSLGLLNERNQNKRNESTIHESKSTIEKNQDALTPSLVKEIAESVKDVIIKDLRKELAGVYLKTTQTTTPSMSTTIKTTKVNVINIVEDISSTTLKTRTHEKDNIIMDKFMDLYEQIKSLKQPTFSLRVNNKSSLLVDLKEPEKATEKNTMIFAALERQNAPVIKESKPLLGNRNPFGYYNSYSPKKQIQNHLPITIQTNSVEIQPLAIPLTKPESLIQQNIVVYSGHQQISDDRSARYPTQTGHKQFKSDTHINPYKRYETYNSPHLPLYNLQELKPREDIIRFRVRDKGNSKLDTDYYEKINFGNDHKIVEKPGIFNNVQRFHEKLERVDTESEVMSSDNNMMGKREYRADFPPRHQLSLGEMKKVSYDDTHFKNFLNTQQKVTDMLERILATKPKTNTPRSVETA